MDNYVIIKNNYNEQNQVKIMINCQSKISAKTNNIINGESVSYGLFALISLFLLVAIKQGLKLFAGVNAGIALLISFVISEIVLYLFEKKFVFRKDILSSTAKQLITLVFRGAVNFGFYKLFDFLFGSLLHMESSFCYFFAAVSSIAFNYFYDRIILFDCNYKARSVKNSRIYKFFYTYRYAALTVAAATVFLLCVYLVYTAFPFGDKTIMRMDLYHQYGPLFAELYERVVNHKSFLYSWYSAGGSSFLGNYFNYLSSPLSALIFLFDKKDIATAITFLVFVKLVLTAGSFSIYLKLSQNKGNIMTVALSLFYASSAYMLAYYWNIMWIDAMILLPIIALGIERIINGKKPIVYIVSLAVLLFSSYYMGFMCCIFAIIYFVFYFAVTSNITDKICPNATYKKKYTLKEFYNNKLINTGVKFAVSSIVAAAVTAFSLVPVFMILRSSSATSDNFPQSFTAYFDIFDFITSHLAGLETTIRSSGEDVLPNIYSGIITIILGPLFIINKKISLKEKACYIAALIVLLFSFNNNCMNFIWHAFHFPNDLPFRFSYIYSFMLLTMASKCLSKFDGIKAKDICYVGILWIFFIILAQKMPTEKISSLTIYLSLALVVLWSGFLYMIREKKATKFISFSLCLVLIFGEFCISIANGINFTYDNADYSQNFNSYSSAINKIHSLDDEMYREELCYLETRMDPSYYGYNGMSVFSSMADEDYSQLQYSLGMFGNRINSYTYNTQTPVYNLMFNIKYLIYSGIGSEPDESLYKLSFENDDKTTVYENKYHLPIAYAVNTAIDIWETDEGNPFELQADFLNLAAGYGNVFEEPEYISTEFDSISGDEVTSNGTYFLDDSNINDEYGSAYITLKTKRDGNVYLYITSPDIKNISVSGDDKFEVDQNIDEPYILDLGYYDADKEIIVTLDCSNIESENVYYEIYCYSLNKDVLDNSYNRLKENSINLTSHTETSFEGTISVENDSYLYTSLPYDKGWTVEIDGQRVETLEIADAMLATMIKKGDHTVRFSYMPQGLRIGIAISAVSFIGSLLYFSCPYISKKLKKRENDYRDIKLQEK